MTELTESVRKAIEANQTERFKRLDNLEAHVDGRQYEGRKSWWDDSVPAWERRPCIRYAIIANAIRDNVSLLAGESRFPRITSRPGESDVLTDTGLGADQSAVLDAHLRALQRVTRFRAHVRAQLRAGQSCGTEVGIFGIRNGRPFAETTRAKWCTPTFDGDEQVTSLEIRYCFVKVVKGANGKPEQQAWIFRRLIDDKSDRSWEGKAKPDGSEPSWQKRDVTDHGLGFCPVVWGPFLRECSTHDEIDGQAIHDENAAELLQALDLTLSQRHRSALYLEPQWTESGVQPGFSPTEPGRAPDVQATVKGGAITPQNPATGVWSSGNVGRRGKGRKKGPGHVWQYPDASVKVQLHQANADALTAISEHASDLEAKLAEALAVVFLDPRRIKYSSAMSGRALKILRQRQIDRADEIRDDFGVIYMIPALCMLLRIEAVCLARGESVNVPGAEQVKPLLMGMLTGNDNGWTPPDLTLVWGPYSESDPTEDAQTVTMAKDAEGLVPRFARAQKVAGIFGVEDVTAALEQLDEEAAEAIERQRQNFAEQSQAEAEAFHRAAGKAAKGSQPGDMTDDGDDPAPATDAA